MATKSLTFDIYGRDKTASKTIKGIGREADGLGDRFKKMGALATAGLALAAGAAVKFGVDSVKAFAEAEQAQNRLAFAYEQFPALADTNIEAMRRLNTEMAKKTRYDDDAYALGQAQLAQYGLTGQQIMDLTPLLADYAGKTGKDLPAAAQDLGKALLGQGRALKDIGIDFQDTGTVAGNLDAIMAGLRAQVGGFAEQDAQTAAGKLDILQNKFGEVQETVGEQLMPALDELMALFDDQETLDGFAAGVGDIAKEFAGVKSMIDDIKGVVEWFNAGGLAEENTRDVMDDNLIKGGGALGGLVQWSRDMETVWLNMWGGLEEGTRTGTESVRTGMGGGFSSMRGDMSVFGTDMNSAVSTTWANADGSTRLGVGNVATSTGNGLLDAFGRVLGFSGQVGPQFGTAWAGANTATVGGWGNIEASTGAGVGRVGAKVGEIPGVVKAPFSNAGGWLRSAGENIVSGLIGGISSMIGSAAQTAAKMAAAAVRAAKDALNINSPSRVFRDIGVNVGKGYIAGLEDQMLPVSASVEAMVAPPNSLTSGGSSVTSYSPAIYVQNPWTGEYMEARMAAQAAGAVNSFDRQASRESSRRSTGY